MEYCKPSQTRHVFGVCFCTDEKNILERKDYGKWLVFKHFDELDETWEKIRTAVANGELQGCTMAECTTLKYLPSEKGPGPSTTAVICVYTEEHDIDVIGFKLIEIACQDIKYKTEEACLKNLYTHCGHGRVSLKTIYWNKGKPSFECEGKPCYGTSFKKEDIWHLNVVTAPEPFNSEEVHGRWILYLENDELTELWHYLKDMIECKQTNFGIIEMVCPPKRVRKSPTESSIFHIYTSSKNRKSVGRKLIERDMDYEQKPQYRNMRCVVETLYWNDGEPDYERIRRKGITKNWRTGEDLS